MPSLRSARSSPIVSRSLLAVFEPSRSNARRAAARVGAVRSLIRATSTSWRSIHVAPPASPRRITPRCSSTPHACCASAGSTLALRASSSKGSAAGPTAASSAHSRIAARSLPVAWHAWWSHASSSSVAPPSCFSPASEEILRSRIAIPASWRSAGSTGPPRPRPATTASASAGSAATPENDRTRSSNWLASPGGIRVSS
jgi:hypothetical protein